MKRFGVTVLLLLAACSDGPTAVLDAPFYQASSRQTIDVSPAEVSLAAGQSITLSSSEPLGRWSTDEPTIATVSSTGVVTGHRAGTAIITIKHGRDAGSATVTVTAPPPVEEPPADEPPADEPPADEPPADEPSADEPPADEPPADEPPADEPPADEPPADEPPVVQEPTSPAVGIWLSGAEVAALPTSGAAWDNLLATANSDCGTPDLSNQDQTNNVCVMAQALVYARTGTAAYREGVLYAIRSIVNSGTYSGRALALGRELGAYVISADLIGLPQIDPGLDGQFRSKLRELLTTPTTDGPRNLVHCHELRPNNWGTHCGGSRVAVAVYLGDSAELARAAQVFKGYLGDRSSYAGFSYGDLSWQCDEARPVGINPTGCMKDGHPVGGVLPDDQRRSGSFEWPPAAENYVYEALQGALVQAVILSRRGYDVWSWEDGALLRAFRWLHDVASFPAEGDDTWQPHVINRAYGTSFPAPVPARAGKNVGWTDWTHR